MCALEDSHLPEKGSEGSLDIPIGTVTFLFTDIEGSTELLKHLRKQYKILLADHHHIMRRTIARWNGYEVETQGDAFVVTFIRATEAVAAAVEAQRSFASHLWPKGMKLKVRMGMHTGEPWNTEEGYAGIDIHRAARIANASHGGQVLLSEITTALVMDELPQGVSLLDLGRHLLKDMRRPEHIHQLVIEGLQTEFPPLRSLGTVPSEAIHPPELVRQPPFLQSEGGFPKTKPVFVASDLELEKLDLHLREALSGQGGIVFITGGPGRGKTALMNEFSWWAMELHPDLLVVKGSCDAYSGVGDPYLPFRDVLTMLSGDLETRWSAGLISKEQVERLWKILPEAINTIMEQGPDLIKCFLTAGDLLNRLQGIDGIHPELLGRLQVLVRYPSPPSGPSVLDQTALFGQFVTILSTLAKRRPIVLILDDLQWMDTGSVNLLFQLGRRLVGSKILLVGAYRSEEVTLGREGVRHPLGEVLTEFKRQFGDVWIDLDNLEANREQQFVEAYLQTEPNLLSQTFRQALYEHTEGHPLFTIELLRNLKDHGDLVRDQQGRWIERGSIKWDLLPSRVEGVIEERIGRLGPEQREILTTASVEGEEFTVQIIAYIHKIDERELLRTLSQTLDRQHHLIADRGMEKVNGKTLFIFSFRHHLFQKYLYDQLNEPERVVFHKAVGEALETLYTGSADVISPRLARHFDLAGSAEKAVEYYTMAGKHALRVSANQEALTHFQRALHLINGLPVSDKRNQQELDLQLSLGPPLTAVKGWGAPEIGTAYDRAQELCAELTDPTQLVRALWLLAVYRLGRSEHDQVENLIGQLSKIAKQTGDPRLVWMNKFVVSPFYRGNFIEAREKLESTCQLYELNQERALSMSFGMAPSVVGKAYLSNCLWLLGYPNKAHRSIKEAFRWAEEIKIPFASCYVLGRSCWLYTQLDDLKAVRSQAERLLKITKEHRFKSFEPTANFFKNLAKVQSGVMDGSEIEQMHQAMEEILAMGTILNRTQFLTLFGDACAITEKTELGLKAIDEAIILGLKTGELWLQAEAYRLKGDLLAQQAQKEAVTKASYDDSEKYLWRAYEIARSQGSLSLELRAVISLFKLGKKKGISHPARQMLKEVYVRFEEGFNTRDLIEAEKIFSAQH
jgi:class 3 adenylate cyclase/tetratricopeptide (TPR) repeat protein